jgi:hypothetical protein
VFCEAGFKRESITATVVVLMLHVKGRHNPTPQINKTSIIYWYWLRETEEKARKVLCLRY